MPQKPQFTYNPVWASVDYLTLTTSNQFNRTTLKSVAQSLSEGIVSNGEGIIKEWHWKEYRGWQLDMLKWGSREDTDILMVAGQLADDIAYDVVLKPHRVRRLDLAVTVELDPLDPEAISQAWANLPTSKEEGIIATETTWILNGNGGETLYLGKRTSDRFARLYDKGLQQGGEEKGHILRYELELKRDVAQAHWDAINAEKDPRPAINAMVWDHFAHRGVNPKFIRKSSQVIVELNARFTSIDRTLLWLKSGVSPAVKRLIMAGRGFDVAKALDIEIVDPGTGEVYDPYGIGKAVSKNGFE